MMIARRLGILGTRQTLRVVDAADYGWAYQCLTPAPEAYGRLSLLCIHHVGHEGPHSWETANVGAMAPPVVIVDDPIQGANSDVDWARVARESADGAPDPAEFAVNACGEQGPSGLTCGRARHVDATPHRAVNPTGGETTWRGRWSDPEAVSRPFRIDRCMWVLGPPRDDVRCTLPDAHDGPHEWSNPSPNPS